MSLDIYLVHQLLKDNKCRIASDSAAICKKKKNLILEYGSASTGDLEAHTQR